MEILGLLILIVVFVVIAQFSKAIAQSNEALNRSNEAFREIEDIKEKLVKLHQNQIDSLTQDLSLIHI